MAMILVARHPKRSQIIMGVVALALIAVPFAPDSVWKRFSGMRHAGNTEELAEVDAEGSARQRFEILKIALTISKENSVYGVGFGAYPFAHREYALRPEFDPTGRGLRDTHNTYVNVMAETGVPGLVLFLGLVLSVMVPADRVRRQCWKLNPERAQHLLLLELGLLAYFIAGIWGTFNKRTFLYVHLTLLWSMTDIVRRELALGTPRRSFNRGGAAGGALSLRGQR
jgi:O-antigen ligase